MDRKSRRNSVSNLNAYQGNDIYTMLLKVYLNKVSFCLFSFLWKILKPSLNQETFVDYEEEITENFTFSRRKSMKRVSFAGRDEVK